MVLCLSSCSTASPHAPNSLRCIPRLAWRRTPPDHGRSGVGTRLFNAVLEPYADVRQQVLIPDDEPAQRAFYESLGFTEVHDFVARQLRSFVRFQK